MKYMKQLLIILAFTGVGEALAYLVPFPIPAAIYGLVLLLIALGTGLLKTSQVKDAANFLISIMPILYVPICVKILEYWGVISQNAAAIVSITVVSTFLVFAVSGLVTQAIMKKKERKRHD
jgi:holin-like protein